jgi:hypothetical protein
MFFEGDYDSTRREYPSPCDITVIPRAVSQANRCGVPIDNVRTHLTFPEGQQF